MKNGFVLFTTLFFVFIHGSSFAAGAVIEAIGGADHVQVNRSGKQLLLKKGESLELGDELSTDQRTSVDVRLDDRTTIRVGVNSSYKMVEDSHSKQLFHRLLSGIVRILVPQSKEPGKKEIRFRMTTPEGTIGVRGTEFVVQHLESKGQTVLHGLEGIVSFGPENTDFSATANFVEVKKGFQSSITKGAAKAVTPEAFDLDAYKQQINGPMGAFAPLAGRLGSEQISRGGAVPVTATAPTPVSSKVLDSGKKQSMGSSGGSNSSSSASIGGGGAIQLPAHNPTPSPGAEAVQKSDPNFELMQAVVTGDMAKVKNAVDAKKANVNFRDEENGYSPLYAAVTTDALDTEKKLEMMFFLVSRDANVDIKNKRGQTPLMAAALEENIDPKVAQYLYENGADPELKDKSGKNFKQYATDLNREKMLQWLKSIAGPGN